MQAVDEAAGDREEIPFSEAQAAVESVAPPELETPPRRTRQERIADKVQPTEPRDIRAEVTAAVAAVDADEARIVGDTSGLTADPAPTMNVPEPTAEAPRPVRRRRTRA